MCVFVCGGVCVCVCEKGHYEDGRRCHREMVFVAMQAFSSPPLSLSQLMLLLQWPFQEAVEAERRERLNGKQATLEFKGEYDLYNIHIYR